MRKEQRELQITAFHEAGHCVAAVVLGLHFLSLGVTLIPDETDLGNTFVVPPRLDDDGILRYLTYLLCGGVAEKMLAGDEKHKVLGAASDIKLAENVLKRSRTNRETALFGAAAIQTRLRC